MPSCTKIAELWSGAAANDTVRGRPVIAPPLACRPATFGRGPVHPRPRAVGNEEPGPAIPPDDAP